MKSFFLRMKNAAGRVTMNQQVFDGVSTVTIQNGQVTVDDVLVGNLSNQLKLDIRVEGDVAELTTASGDVRVQGQVGRVTTSSGDVQCDAVAGDVATASGDVTCNRIAGSVRTVSGDIGR